MFMYAYASAEPYVYVYVCVGECCIHIRRDRMSSYGPAGRRRRRFSVPRAETDEAAGHGTSDLADLAAAQEAKDPLAKEHIYVYIDIHKCEYRYR